MTRGVDDLLAAVIGRLGDIATKLPDEVIKAMPEIPWREVKGMRIIAAHAYHRIDYEEVWSLCVTTSREWTRRSSTGVRPKPDRADSCLNQGNQNHSDPCLPRSISASHQAPRSG